MTSPLFDKTRELLKHPPHPAIYIIGIATLWDKCDLENVKISKNAINKTFADKFKPVPMHLEHKNECVGVWNQLTETPTALIASGYLSPNAPFDIARKLANKQITGLSVSITPLACNMDDKSLTITSAKLKEISLVKNPYQPNARILRFGITNKFQ